MPPLPPVAQYNQTVTDIQLVISPQNILCGQYKSKKAYNNDSKNGCTDVQSFTMIRDLILLVE